MTVQIKDALMHIQHDLPPQQKRLCKYMLEHLKDVSTMTINTLSSKSGVGTTTILRFIKKIGFTKYPDFKRELTNDVFRAQQETWWHLQKSLEDMDDDKNSIVKVGKTSVHDIQSMVRTIDQEQYEQILHVLLQANKNYILGLRTSKSIALYFEMMLKGIVDNVTQLSWAPDFLFDESLDFKETDTIVVIALSPYTKMTMDFVHYCSETKDASIVLITDVETCPAIQYADAYVVVGQSEERYSIIPAITLIEALIIDIGKNQSGSIEHISEINTIHKDNGITTT